MIHHSQPLFGSIVHLSLDGAAETSSQKEASKALELIRSIQRMTNFHDVESDVSRLNRCAHLNPLRIHPWTWNMLHHAIELSAETAGAFDITLAPKQVCAGYHPRHQSFTLLAEANAWKQIELLPDSYVRFHRPIQIDLGSLTKGFAVDKAIDYLSTRGFEHATIRVGDEICRSGSLQDDDEPSPEHRPDGPTPVPMLRPAVVTSAAYFAKTRNGVSRVRPPVHPQTGKTLRSNTSVSVYAPTCLEASALTQAVLLAPQKLWTKLLQSRDSAAVFLTNQGEEILFPG